MSGLVSFDQGGVLGPLATLIFQADYFNEAGVTKIANLLEENFKKLSGKDLQGKKEFCAYVLSKNSKQHLDPQELISTPFLRMKGGEVPEKVHEMVVTYLAKPLFKDLKQKLAPDQRLNAKEEENLEDWFGRVLESYISKEQLEEDCNNKKNTHGLIQKERERIGKDLYITSLNDQFTEKDLNLFLRITKTALETITTPKACDHSFTVLKFTGEYLKLFSLEKKTPKEFGENILKLLDTVFRKKIFPSSEEKK